MGEKIGARAIALEWVLVHYKGLVKPDDAIVLEQGRIQRDHLAPQALHGPWSDEVLCEGCRSREEYGHPW